MSYAVPCKISPIASFTDLICGTKQRHTLLTTLHICQAFLVSNFLQYLSNLQVNMVYKTSSLARLYLGSEINSFANGSIIVDYTVLFINEGMVTNATTPRIDSSMITSAFMESLRSAIEMGTLNITIDESSVSVTGKLRTRKSMKSITKYF